MPSSTRNPAIKGSALVIGGGGFYGRYVVADLVRYTDADIIVASRNPPSARQADRVRIAVCDVNDLATLEKLAANCAVLVHCAGPFQSLPLNPLHAAIQTGVNYV